MSIGTNQFTEYYKYNFCNWLFCAGVYDLQSKWMRHLSAIIITNIVINSSVHQEYFLKNEKDD